MVGEESNQNGIALMYWSYPTIHFWCDLDTWFKMIMVSTIKATWNTCTAIAVSPIEPALPVIGLPGSLVIIQITTNTKVPAKPT